MCWTLVEPQFIASPFKVTAPNRSIFVRLAAPHKQLVRGPAELATTTLYLRTIVKDILSV